MPSLIRFLRNWGLLDPPGTAPAKASAASLKLFPVGLTHNFHGGRSAHP
jgi:hypothetical protein